MKNSTFLKSLLTLLVMVVWGGQNGAMAQTQTYTHTFVSGDLGTASNVTTSPAGSKTLSDCEWVFNLTKKNDNYYLGWDSTKGVQIGSSKQPATSITLSTSKIPGSITSIVVNTSGASSINATFNVSVGGTVFSPSTVSLTATATNYTFEGSAKGEVVLSWANTSDKAVYIKSISITYTTSSSETPTASAPTFTPDGGTVERGSTVDLACSTTGATIYYAINAADPETAEGTAYTTPIAINEDCSITAWAKADNLDASARVTKNFVAADVVTFQKANNVVSGQKYLIFADNKIGIPHTSDYGYLAVTAATPTEEVIKQFSETNAFTFTAVEGGYTIQDSNDKYYYQSGTYNNFNVSETLPEDGSGVWSVEPQLDGTFKITNNIKNKYIQYTPSFGTYGSYADPQSNAILPILYTNGVDLGPIVTKKEQTLTFSGTVFSVSEDETFTAPELTGAQTTVTYSSSNEDVATVDAATGAITIVGVGLTTITATAESTNEYYEATAQYTLTVIANLSNGGTVTFDFTDPESLGLAVPAIGNETSIDNAVTSGAVTMTATHGNTMNTRIYNSNGSMDLRIYKNGGSITFAVPDGYEITSITYTGHDKPTNWIGSAQSVTVTAEATLRISTATITYARVYTLNISAAGYATFTADKNFIIPAGIEGGIVTVEGTTANVNYVYTEGDIVPANTGLLMKGEAGEYKMYATTQEATEVYSENLLQGALTNDVITAPDNTLLYIFANDSESGLGFYWQKDSNNGQQVQNMAGKAYLQVPTTSAVQGFRLNLGDTTGITAVESTNGNAPVYTLSGVRVNGSLNNLPAGIYIVGGKKVYVK